VPSLAASSSGKAGRTWEREGRTGTSRSSALVDRDIEMIVRLKGAAKQVVGRESVGILNAPFQHQRPRACRSQRGEVEAVKERVVLERVANQKPQAQSDVGCSVNRQLERSADHSATHGGNEAGDEVDPLPVPRRTTAQNRGVPDERILHRE